jgi:hypothetical protein
LRCLTKLVLFLSVLPFLSYFALHHDNTQGGVGIGAARGITWAWETITNLHIASFFVLGWLVASFSGTE